ncbi:MAG: GFA family protein, partial [Alphaproteobacteria bacterium]|nr:GFA family protein [Alphaproteobacteria bacterium]
PLRRHRRLPFPRYQSHRFFCPECGTYVWSQYAGGRLAPCRFVRVGTLDEPDRHPPDVHIYTGSKQPWVLIPQDAPRFQEFYELGDVWPESSLVRMEPYWRDRPNH